MVDPNTALAELRDLAKAILDGPAPSQHIWMASRLAIRFEALDQWLIDGGNPPDDWRNSISPR